MRCLICKRGSTEPGTTTVTLERDGLIMVIKGVPAQVCENCAEAYVDEKVACRASDVGGGGREPRGAKSRFAITCLTGSYNSSRLLRGPSRGPSLMYT